MERNNLAAGCHGSSAHISKDCRGSEIAKVDCCITVEEGHTAMSMRMRSRRVDTSTSIGIPEPVLAVDQRYRPSLTLLRPFWRRRPQYGTNLNHSRRPVLQSTITAMRMRSLSIGSGRCVRHASTVSRYVRLTDDELSRTALSRKGTRWTPRGLEVFEYAVSRWLKVSGMIVKRVHLKDEACWSIVILQATSFPPVRHSA